MDQTDLRLIALLRQNARASISELAAALGVARTTVRSRIEKLEASGDIVGFSVVLKGDVDHAPVRALMMIGIDGRGTERVMRHVAGFSEVTQLWSTNGQWDLIAEIGAQNLAELDEVLFRIRRLDSVTRSETSLLLSTRKTS